MKLTDKINFAVSLRVTPSNLFFLASSLVLAVVLPFGAHLLG